MIEKVALAQVLTARRMCPYFHNYFIIVSTDYPIFKILSKFDRKVDDRVTIELLEFNIQYELRGAIKSQCLIDFSVELTPLPDLRPNGRKTRPHVEKESS